MATSAEEHVQILGKSWVEEKKWSSSKDGGRNRCTLKELQEKKYPHSDSDLSEMLDALLENGITELPLTKRLKRLEELLTKVLSLLLGH